MSNRAVKKAFGGDKELKASPDSDDEAPVSFGAAGGRPARNPYELLNELSESEAKEDDGQPDEGNDGHKSGDSSRMDDESSQSVTKKKKRRRRPGRSKKRAPMGSGSDRALDTEMEDEISFQQRQKTRIPPREHLPLRKDKVEVKQSKELQTFEQMFKIDNKLLNPEFELKKIFGAKVINYERGKQGQRRIHRHTKLIDPRESWRSAVGTGVSMSFVEANKHGYLYFKFEHSKEYQDVQKQFIRAVNTLNPDNIVNILKIHPYHIDSHIQLSDMAKSAEDMQVAAELIEGGLYCLENAFHARFNLAVPSCRLDYKYQENRAFYILLFKHLTFVGQRACHRTALELCKRLLISDPDNDPLCATLMIDFYAIKAGEYRWFINLFNYWEKSKNLSQLPNFAYSIALAYHLLSTSKKQDPGKASGDKADVESGSGTGSSNISTCPEELSKLADKHLQYAILMFPSVILPLLEKCSVQVDSRTKNHNFFNSQAQNSQTRSLKLLCDLYVWRSHHVWRDPSVLAWLEKNVLTALDRVDGKDQIVRDYEEKRKRRYLATIPRNILRHILLTDNKELTINLPTELRNDPILNYDPLPPPDSIDIYNTRESRNLVPSTGSPQRNGLLSMLFRSFLYDLNDPDAPFQLDEQAAAAAVAAGERELQGVGAGFQQSVTALLDAMRDLLSNVNARGEGEGADGDESEGEGEGENA